MTREEAKALKVGDTIFMCTYTFVEPNHSIRLHCIPMLVTSPFSERYDGYGYACIMLDLKSKAISEMDLCMELYGEYSYGDNFYLDPFNDKVISKLFLTEQQAWQRLGTEMWHLGSQYMKASSRINTKIANLSK